MPSEEALEIVDEMLLRIKHIENLCLKNGGAKAALQDDEGAQPAIIMHLITIYELIRQLQEKAEMDVINCLSRDSIRSFSTTRNIASHNYKGLNFNIVEAIIRNPLPQLKQELIAVMTANGRDIQKFSEPNLANNDTNTGPRGPRR